MHHFHVRITCPSGSVGCEEQKPVSGNDGCGTELDDWFKKLRQAELHPAQPGAPGKPPLTLDDLPKDCRTVLNSPEKTPLNASGAAMLAPTKAGADKPAGPPPLHLPATAIEASSGMPLPTCKPH
jgi:penicillin-insensitive murein DD-endopeptidase